MALRTTLLAAALGLVIGTSALAPPADARPRDREQEAAYKGTRDGHFLPLRAIESRVLPRMGGADYLGPELDPGAGIYRLKFMRGGRVIWVDVDARTGQVLGRSGH